MLKLTDKFKEKLTDIECVFAGNRITAAGRTCLLSLIPILTYMPENLSKIEDLLYAGLVLTPLSLGIYGELHTSSGITTIQIYHRTKQHIKQYGKIDERFVKAIFSEGYYSKENEISDKTIYGYCEWQGIYLASKALRKTKEFKELKDKYYKKSTPLF